jgi:hypothetical protein
MKAVVKKIKFTDKKSDFAWWQDRSYAERLAALEQIREEYNQWKYGNQQGFQSVYSVLKRS